MKAYIYKGFGELILDGIEEVGRPDDADIFIAGTLDHFRDPRILPAQLKYFRPYADRHVFFDISDHETVYNESSLFIRCNLRPFNLTGDPNSIAWPWPVEDFKDWMHVPASGFQYDLSFQGWVWSETRKLSTSYCNSAAAENLLTFDFSGYRDFYGYLDRAPNGKVEAERRSREFRRSMRESRLALCPESIPGVFPYRFWEALSAARVPVLVGDDFQFPFADEIPYRKFMLHISRASIPAIGELIRKWLDLHSDKDLIELGQMGRSYYDKYLHRDKWRQLHAYAVEKKLKELGMRVA